MIILYHKTKIPIGFLCKRNSNSDNLFYDNELYSSWINWNSLYIFSLILKRDTLYKLSLYQVFVLSPKSKDTSVLGTSNKSIIFLNLYKKERV